MTPKAPTAAKKLRKPMRQAPAAPDEREADLAELRRQRAATAEILGVISQTPTDPQPVFERIVMAATRALRCHMAVMLVREGDVYVHTAAATSEGLVPDFAPERFPIDAEGHFPSRAFLAKTMLHLPDWSQIDLPKHERWVHETFGITSALYLPLLRDDESDARARVCWIAAQSLWSGRNRSSPVVSGPGLDRDRERAPLRRDTAGAGAANRDGRNIEGDRQFALRRAAGFRGDRDHSKSAARRNLDHG